MNWLLKRYGDKALLKADVDDSRCLKDRNAGYTSERFKRVSEMWEIVTQSLRLCVCDVKRRRGRED